MNIFNRRPFMICCACFLATAAMSFCIVGNIKLMLLAVSLAACIVCVILFVCLKSKEAKIRSAVVLTAFLFISAAFFESFIYFDVYSRSAEQSVGRTCSVNVMILSEESSSFSKSSYYASLNSIDDQKVSGKVYLEFSFPAGLRAGDTITVDADGITLEEAAYNDSYKFAMISDGITAAFTADPKHEYGLHVEDSKILISSFFRNINLDISSKLEKDIKGEAGKLSSALLLGNREHLSDETIRDFSRTGIAHVLSLSGLHMAVLAGFLELVMRRFFVPKLARCGLIPFAMLAYLALTGFTLPAIRAAIMLTVVYFSFVNKTPSDAITTLFAVCAFILLILPSSVADVGFWMSFLATMGIIIVYPVLTKRFPKKKDKIKIKRFMLAARKYIITGVSVTASAVFSVLLPTWLCFGELSLIAPIANLLLSPLVSLMIIISLLYLALSFVPYIGLMLSRLVGLLGGAILNLTSDISKLRGIVISLRYEFTAWIVILFCVFMLILLIVKLKKLYWLLVPPLAAVLAFTLSVTFTNILGNDKTVVTYISRGEREMICLTCNGQAVLCDIGDGSFTNHTAAMDIMHDNDAVTELEVLLLTHYHDKYRTSTERLFSSMRVRAVWIPEPDNDTELILAKEIIKIAETHDVSVSIYKYGSKMSVLGACNLTVLCGDKIARSNQVSNALLIENGNSSVLYLGSSYNDVGVDFSFLESNRALPFEAVIFGTHGPNPQKPMLIDSRLKSKIILFANRELLELTHAENNLYYDNIIVNAEYKRMLLAENSMDN